MRSKCLRALIFATIALASPLLAQNFANDEFRWGSRPYVPQQPNVIRVRTNVVQVPVVVRDSKGKAIGGLTKSDFELFDNGRQVQIASFAVENVPPASTPAATRKPTTPVRESPPPPPPPTPSPTTRYIALFFDDTSMRVYDVTFSRKAAESFVQHDLKPGDKVGIFTTSTTVSLDFTDNVPKLLETLAQLRTHQKRPSGIAGNPSCQVLNNPYQAFLITQFYIEHSDAMDLAIAEGCGDPHDIQTIAQYTLTLAEQFAQDTLGIITDVIHYLGRMPGHRMMILASSGFLTQTLQEKQDKVINEALGANVIINSLDAKGLVAEVPGQDEDGNPVVLLKPPFGKWIAVFDEYKTANREVNNDPLALLAEGTGGKLFHNRNDLDVGLREMAAAPDVSYVLSFSPVDLKANGATHDLKVKVPGVHGASIQARRGYLAPSPNPTDSEKKQRKLDSAVLAADNSESMPAQLATETGSSGTGQPILKVEVHVDVTKLPYQTEGDRKVERLIFVTALFDTDNHFLAGTQGIMDLRLKKETLATVSNQGLDAKLSLEVPPGNYRLRQVVQETGDGRITAISRPVEIR
jgi:VWFA-related protein